MHAPHSIEQSLIVSDRTASISNFTKSSSEDRDLPALRPFGKEGARLALEQHDLMQQEEGLLRRFKDLQEHLKKNRRSLRRKVVHYFESENDRKVVAWLEALEVIGGEELRTEEEEEEEESPEEKQEEDAFQKDKDGLPQSWAKRRVQGQSLEKTEGEIVRGEKSVSSRASKTETSSMLLLPGKPHQGKYRKVLQWIRRKGRRGDWSTY
jgi:hypothetical protein